MFIRMGVLHLRYVHLKVYNAIFLSRFAVQILSGQLPFPYLAHDAQVIMQLFNGTKSRRPETPYVTDQLWEFINQCWADTPTTRPAAEELLESIHRFRENEISRLVASLA